MIRKTKRKSNMPNSVFHEQLPMFDATFLAQGIQKRMFTSLDVVEAFLKRIERDNKTFNAIVTVNEAILEQAKEADSALARGEFWGPLHGVPITVKDAYMTKNIRTTVGHKKFENFIPKKDATAIEKLKNAGALVLGKTNCPQLCIDVQTHNALFGVTVNPWDVNRTCGGSSGGEAAAIALHFSPLGIGSDTGGSIRQPASYCGIYGLKPTNNVISREGLIPPLPGTVDLDNHLTVVGPMARSVRDLSLCFEILAEEKVAESEAGTAPKVAWTVDFPGAVLDDEIRDMIINAADHLKVSGIEMEKTDSMLDVKKILNSAFELFLFEFIPSGVTTFSPFLRKIFWKTLFRGGTFNYYKELLHYRAQLAQEIDQFLNQRDCWLIPATPTTAFHHNTSKTPLSIKQNGKRQEVGYFRGSTMFTFPFNFTGHPAVVIPIGMDSQGMPVAVQLVGKRGHDAELLRVASLVDKKVGGLGSTPREIFSTRGTDSSCLGKEF